MAKTNCTIATRDYWHARIFATKRTINKYLNFDKMRRMGLCRDVDGHILVSEWACATNVRNDVISLEVDLDKRLT